MHQRAVWGLLPALFPTLLPDSVAGAFCLAQRSTTLCLRPGLKSGITEAYEAFDASQSNMYVWLYWLGRWIYIEETHERVVFMYASTAAKKNDYLTSS